MGVICTVKTLESSEKEEVEVGCSLLIVWCCAGRGVNGKGLSQPFLPISMYFPLYALCVGFEGSYWISLSVELLCVAVHFHGRRVVQESAESHF